MSELTKVDIYRQIDVLRHNLLDLTMRNQLLNFRPRSMTVEVKDGDLAEIYDRLVLKKSKRKLLQFIPKTELETPVDDSLNQDKTENTEKTPLSDVENEIPGEGGSDSLESGTIETEETDESSGKEKVSAHGTEGTVKIEREINLTHNSILNGANISGEDVSTAEESSLLWETPAPDQDMLEKNKEILLQTSLTGSELQRRLFYINQRARSVMEEQGYNILYLALGFLRWKDENGAPEYREAPLILVPVELERRRVKGSFKLRWTGEDIIPNISLQAKLLEQGVEIPDFEMPRAKEGVQEY